MPATFYSLLFVLVLATAYCTASDPSQCGSAVYGKKQGFIVPLDTAYIQPSISTAQIMVPTVCPSTMRHVGTEYTVCDSDFSPTVLPTSLTMAYVQRNGLMRDTASVAVVVFCYQI